MANSMKSGGGSNNGSVYNGSVGGIRGHCGRVDEKHQRYNPFKMRDKSNTTTATGALVHLIKSSLGSGILAMPNAFKNGGLIFGLVGTAAIGVLCSHCIYLLVLCSQTLCRRTRRPALGFADTAAVAFNTGPHRLRAWAPFARGFVNVALFCTYYFGNCVYVILIAASFKQVAENHTPPEWHFSIRVWILSLAIPLIPLGIIRTLKVLVPLSALGTTFILVGLGCTMTWVVTGVSPFADKATIAASVPLPDIGSRPWIAPVARMPLFFATVVFAMEGIGTVLPIENSMRHPEYFLRARPCGVLNGAMTLVVSLYSIAGFIGYLRFGDTTEGSITLNLPNDLLCEIIKMMVTLSIVFSYGLQFCVPSEIVWSHLEPWLHKRRLNSKYSTSKNDIKGIPTISKSCITDSIVTMNTAISTKSIVTIDENKLPEEKMELLEEPVDGMYYIMRAIMIVGTLLISAAVPNLSPVIALFGAVLFSTLGLFCPAVIHLVAFWEHNDEEEEDFKEPDFDDDLEYEVDNYAVYDAADLEYGNKVRWKQQEKKNCDLSVSRTKGMSKWIIIKDISIVIIAAMALVFGTYASLIDIFAFYGSDIIVNEK
ncbi:proton-coupled amino acid transporter-like protein pathetic [Sipha flava]|uniref:Proton-coupled amino acid transporter 4 n=1 Tax=Sipha flava TaxID=143950 RepID=A0A2S2PVZ4_9HEMI|nr:proton-coupled amino acid transporter-like protein pathetic [Sipha flava]